VSIRIINGDCRDVLATLPPDSVHCCVTSPPYWGLRDYGTAKWEGGVLGCDHQESAPSRTAASIASSSLDGGKGSVHLSHQFKGDCLRCGARRIDSQIGLESTYQEYVEQMVAVFREVRRVMRRDGTCWLNLGDSYAASRSYQVTDNMNPAVGPTRHLGRAVPPAGLKQKDLVGIPWRVAFALQDDGWYLRQDLIWSKPNPMPESVTDRCTKAHEYLFLLTKSARYYYDAEAIKEGASANTHARGSGIGIKNATVDRSSNILHNSDYASKINGYVDRRNKRSVWEVATQPFSEAHFATFPPALIEPCILAGCPKGGTVLDPFGGAGTTGLVADRLQRSAILIELNPEYAAMAQRRIYGDSPLFTQTAAE
jgi:site-specific DNA-methyltransferase (adenine-specific)